MIGTLSLLAGVAAMVAAALLGWALGYRRGWDDRAALAVSKATVDRLLADSVIRDEVAGSFGPPLPTLSVVRRPYDWMGDLGPVESVR
jgi:hypothetical protein